MGVSTYKVVCASEEKYSENYRGNSLLACNRLDDRLHNSCGPEKAFIQGNSYF